MELPKWYIMVTKWWRGDGEMDREHIYLVLIIAISAPSRLEDNKYLLNGKMNDACQLSAWELNLHIFKLSITDFSFTLILERLVLFERKRWKVIVGILVYQEAFVYAHMGHLIWGRRASQKRIYLIRASKDNTGNAIKERRGVGSGGGGGHVRL